MTSAPPVTTAASETPASAGPDVSYRTVDIAVIGGGISGIGLAVALRRRGFDNFVVVERADEVGGTWRDNTYPGAGCDVPSHLYSFSFDLNPEWSQSFSSQEEIQRYLTGVADRHGIRDSLLLGHDVTGARWDAATRRWLVDTDHGSISAGIIVSAMGVLCEPKLPAIDGLDRFRGPVFHSSQWDHSYDLTGKRVAVIGTGASAIQIVPSIADRVARLDVHQRTAPWIFPKLLRRYSAPEKAALRRIPGLISLFRSTLYLTRESYAVILIKYPTAAWALWLIAMVKMRLEIGDGSLRRKVTPRYRAGCTRMLISNTYYRALGRRNVELIDTEIESVTEDSIVTSDGMRRAVDAIVLATGFHVSDSPAYGLIRGGDGRTVAEVFTAEGISAYKGSTIAGFPNMFVLLGPNSALAFTSTIYMIESQIRYVVDAIATLNDAGVDTFEVREDVQESFNTTLQRRMRRSIWVTGGCRSWFLDDTGRNFAMWPDFSFRFRRMLRKFDMEAYATTRRQTDRTRPAARDGEISFAAT